MFIAVWKPIKINRDTSNNIKDSDYALYKKLFLSTRYKLCEARFISKIPPTLDRIKKDFGYSMYNMKPWCIFSSKFKSNKNENLTWFVIQ